jgi:prepilin-type N-terminal cleavage/methylation domain-containing protein
MSEAGDPQSGMTLIEALVVVAIAGFVAALVYPVMEKATLAFSIRSDASALASNLRMARAVALREGGTVFFAVAPGGDGYEADGVAHPLSSGETLQGGDVSFYRDGSASGGTLSITGNGKRISLTIDPATGAVSMAGT